MSEDKQQDCDNLLIWRALALLCISIGIMVIFFSIIQSGASIKSISITIADSKNIIALVKDNFATTVVSAIFMGVLTGIAAAIAVMPLCHLGHPAFLARITLVVAITPLFYLAVIAGIIAASVVQSAI